MKLSKACIFGLVGCILLCLNLVINFITVMTSEYYHLDVSDLFMWFISFGGWVLMIVFLFFLMKNSQKLDKILRNL